MRCVGYGGDGGGSGGVVDVVVVAAAGYGGGGDGVGACADDAVVSLCSCVLDSGTGLMSDAATPDIGGACWYRISHLVTFVCAYF